MLAVLEAQNIFYIDTEPSYPALPQTVGSLLDDPDNPAEHCPTFSKHSSYGCPNFKWVLNEQNYYYMLLL